MPTRPIRTSTTQTACDVCGRTLLRGERAEIYLSGAERRSVCELCTSRALHGGWVREGEAPAFDASNARADRRRTLLRRRRARREPALELDPAISEPVASEPGLRGDTPEPLVDRPSGRPPAATPSRPETPARAERRLRRRRPAAAPEAASREHPTDPGLGREPRHVRAVPTSLQHRLASALELFNGSEHPKTVSGVARSLGLPDVSAHPSDPGAPVVRIVVSWELCWYRYEVDLSDTLPAVRADGQGYELAELSELERQHNATADEHGRLGLHG